MNSLDFCKGMGQSSTIGIPTGGADDLLSKTLRNFDGGRMKVDIPSIPKIANPMKSRGTRGKAKGAKPARQTKA